MRKKIITAVLGAVLAAGILSGCGKSGKLDTKLTICTKMNAEVDAIQKYEDEGGGQNG